MARIRLSFFYPAQLYSFGTEMLRYEDGLNLCGNAPDFVSGFVDDGGGLLQHRTALITLHRYRPDLAAEADIVLTRLTGTGS